MNITLIQPNIRWEDPEANLVKYDRILKELKTYTDLVLLPEMFTTGFTMQSEKYCLPDNNDVIHWMENHASRLNAAISGSLIIKEGTRIYNRLYFIEPDGRRTMYDKRHLFRMGGEGEHFHAGKARTIISYRDWRILPLICYDLRFPVWSRNQEDYDLLLYLANWPAPRSEVWNTLLKARAIENQAWVVGVNRVGADGEGIDYIGESQIIDPKGQVILKMNNNESTGQKKLSLENLRSFQKKFPAWKDRDQFTINT